MWRVQHFGSLVYSIGMWRVQHFGSLVLLASPQVLRAQNLLLLPEWKREKAAFSGRERRLRLVEERERCVY